MMIDAVVLRAGYLLVLSNVFMTFAWYAHLRNLSDRPWYVAALASWGTCTSRLKWDYLWAACCILGAVYFIFQSAGH
jgi:uncharacterized protein (DUF486 family)